MERTQLPCWDLRGSTAMSFLGVLITSDNITVLQPGHKKKKLAPPSQSLEKGVAVQQEPFFWGGGVKKLPTLVFL